MTAWIQAMVTPISHLTAGRNISHGQLQGQLKAIALREVVSDAAQFRF